MNIILDDVSQTATIQDWDATDWASQSSTVPDAYTLIFQPMQPESDLLAAITNRQITYVNQMSYTSQPFGNGYVSIPTITSVQNMQPVVTDTTDTTTS